MRIGVWNLKLAPVPGRERGDRMLALMRDCDADLWLLTEMHTSWELPGYVAVTSEPRSGSPAHRRWSGIMCRDDFRLTSLPPSGSTPADEGLCLARLVTRDGNDPPLLVACSVLPWSNTTGGWPSLHRPGALGEERSRYRFVTGRHLDVIRAQRQPDDVLIWGGDFNESLTGRPLQSRTGRRILVDAFEAFGLVPLTADAPHLVDGLAAIDHLTVPLGWAQVSAVSVIRRADDPRQSSDHALYLIDVEPSGHDREATTAPSR